ncbi:MAG: zinc-ribbon domain-containing protein [Promethearchaeota archaeon]
MERQKKAVCPNCGKQIKIGIKFCTNCGVNLSNLDLTIINTDNRTQIAPNQSSSTQLVSIEDEWVNLKQFVKQKNKNEIKKILVEYIAQISHFDEISRKKIYDLIGKILEEDLQFFKQKLFKIFYKATQKFLVANLRIEMEKYIIEKYWFFKGEKLIISSKGSVIFSKNYFEIRGRFYITNQRIIFLGKHLAGVKRTAAGYGIMEFPYMGGYLFRGMILPYNIRADKFSVPLASIKLEQIKKKKETYLDYILKYEYDYRGITKSIIENLRIVPLQEEGETEKNFQGRRDMVFSKITEFLNTILD